MGDEGDESNLVRRAAEGDAEAFTRLFNRYYQMIYAYAFRLCLNRADAQEIAQETFVKAARLMVGMREHGAFKAWLYRVAHNAATDLSRAASRRQRLGGALEMHEKIRAEERPADSARVAEALDSLPDHLREAIVLTVYEEMSHAEAAHVLGCAEATVSWRVFMARRKLRKLLGGRSE